MDARSGVAKVVEFDDVGVEIRLKNPEDFLKVKETLTRIGIASRREKKLFQSCHILHKRGRYRIIHFKEAFALDGRPTDFDDEDEMRRNTIAGLLREWGLVEVVDQFWFDAQPRAPLSNIKVLTHREKPEWTLEQKYQVGRRRATEVREAA